MCSWESFCIWVPDCYHLEFANGTLSAMLNEFLEILEKYLISLLAKMKHCVIPATKYFFTSMMLLMDKCDKFFFYKSPFFSSQCFNISVHIHLSVLRTFSMVLTRKICAVITSHFCWWSFSLILVTHLIYMYIWFSSDTVRRN